MIKRLIQAIHPIYIRLNRIFMVALVILFSGAPIILLNQTASAAQVTTRSVLISSAQASGTANYTFTFTPSSTTQIQSMTFTSCTTAIGACTAPAGINLSGGAVSQSGFQGAGTFAKDTTSASCTAVSVLCITRTDTTAQTLTAHTIIDTGAVNQNSTNCSAAPNCTFFIRMVTFSDTAYTTQVDYGTVASSTTQLFTVNATIEEELSFCIGSTTVDNATSVIPTCATISGTSLNLGILTSADVSISPVPAGSEGGDGNNGLAELETNSAHGTTVNYDAVQQAGTNQLGTLRVAGATCSTTASNTDQCINAVGVTKATLTAGTEDFGLTVAGINCSNVTAYTCNFSTGATNLTRTANYNCDGTNTYPTTDNNQVAGTSHCSYAWDQTGTAETIASSTTAVGNEGMILKFAATPNLITPTGSYTAKADFVATPSY